MSANEGTFDLLKQSAARGHITYGSDFPFAKNESIKGQAEFVKGVTNEPDQMTRGKDNTAKAEGWEIRRGNALQLFPRLAERLEKGEMDRQTNGI